MNSTQTRGIVLKRTDYGEADRIVTFLTPDRGKLRLMARGVRKPKAKLAGGIELFSVSDISFIRGRSEIGTLISTRLDEHYGRIVKDIERVQTGYGLLKQLDRVTEDEPEPEYFTVMEQALQALDDSDISLELIRAWFGAQLLRLAGHSPNLTTDTGGRKLEQRGSYNFDMDAMAFAPHESGSFKADHIKTLRLLFSASAPQAIAKISGLEEIIALIAPLIRAMAQSQGLASS